MALRTGREYLSALRDGRKILYEGRLVEDVTAEPGFRRTAQAVSEFYDFQGHPAVREVMSYETPDGDRAGIAFLEPRSREDLRRRAAGYAAWAEVTCGLMGRSPDYMNSFMMAVGAASRKLGASDARAGERAQQLYLDARRRDLCLTHTFVSPMADRFKRLPEQPATLRVVRETADGPVLQGARGVATLAPFCDANLSLALTQVPVLAKGEESFAISFVVPVGQKGLTWICRDAYDQERAHYDAPLSGRADEMDCMAIFEECLVPWEACFIYKDVDLYNRQTELLRSNLAAAQQVLMKNIAKTRFLFGLGHLLAESSQISKFVNIQERLGDFAIYLATLESLAMAMVEGAVEDPETGVFYPNPQACLASQRLFPEYYTKMVDHLMQMGGSGFVGMPQERAFERLGASIEDAFRGASGPAKDKVALYRMAWDLVGSTWGSRQELYERFFFGDATRWRTHCYVSADKREAVEMVCRLLRDDPARRFPLPERYR